MKTIRAEQLQAGLDKLLHDNLHLSVVLDTLNHTNIRYGLYAGSHIAALVHDRTTDDIDLLVHDDDITALRKLFPTARTKDTSHGLFLYVGEHDDIEFMGNADVIIGTVVYPFRMSDRAADRLHKYKIGQSEIPLVDIADTILLKAILQRGANQDKHDLEDIEAVLKETDLDLEYLRARVKESGAEARTRSIFEKYGIHL